MLEWFLRILFFIIIIIILSSLCKSTIGKMFLAVKVTTGDVTA